MKKTINIKELNPVKHGSYVYLEQKADIANKDYINKIVVFPTSKEMVDALIENGKQVEELKQFLTRNNANILKAKETLGSLDKVAKFILSYQHKELLKELKLKDTDIEKLNNLYIDWTFMKYIEYCVYTGKYRKELVDKKVKKLIPNMAELRDTESAKKLHSMLYTVIDESAKEEYCGMLDLFTVELDDFSFKSKDTMKSFTIVLEEILNTFN